MSTARKRMPAPLDVQQFTVGGALSGAASGAALGASLGSVIPGWGTAVGTIIGGVGGLISGAVGSGKAKKAEEEAARQLEVARAESRAANELNIDKAALSVFPTEGVEQPSMFDFVAAEGGEIPKGKAGSLRFKALKGGSLKKLGDGIFLASGNSHAEGGIKGDTDGDGQADVEIEDKELFFDEGNGFVIAKDVAKRFIPQFRKIKSNDRLSRETRSRLINQAMAENEAAKMAGRSAA